MVQPNEELSVSQPSPFVRPMYNPPQYLLSSSGLSREEFVAQYEGLLTRPLITRPSLTPSAFKQGLDHIQIAPELVFERLFGNVSAPCTALTVYAVK